MGELKKTLQAYWNELEGYTGPVEIEKEWADEDCAKYIVETEGNRFEVWQYDNGEIFLTAEGVDNAHALDGRKAVMLEGKPYLLDLESVCE